MLQCEECLHRTSFAIDYFFLSIKDSCRQLNVYSVKALSFFYYYYYFFYGAFHIARPN